MVGMVEIELDKDTGEVKILDYVAVVDCGITINPALARIQIEGVSYRWESDIPFLKISLMTEMDARLSPAFYSIRFRPVWIWGIFAWNLKTAMSQQGPFGAKKSIGEIVINTPAPAIAHAIYRATGVWHRELPITPEKILMSMPQ